MVSFYGTRCTVPQPLDTTLHQENLPVFSSLAVSVSTFIYTNYYRRHFNEENTRNIVDLMMSPVVILFYARIYLQLEFDNVTAK